MDTVYVGDLTDVLNTHWSATVSEKTHAFWSHGELVGRIELTFDDVGIDVAEVSEAGSSSTCLVCEPEDVTRWGDAFLCPEYSLSGHSDVAGAWNLLRSGVVVGPMAQPAALSAERGRDTMELNAYWEWDDQDWTLEAFREQSWPFDQIGVSELVSSQPE